MKKLFALLLAACLVVGMTACSSNAAKEEDINAKSEGVMTFDEYWNTAVDAPVTVETYVQAKESWWQDAAVVYTEDGNGAYFLYNLPCTQEEYDKLTPGTKIRVKGYKAEYSGMVEMSPGSFEIISGPSYVASPMDVTNIFITENELAKHMGQLVTVKGLVVEPANDAGDAFMYNWDGSGQEGSDVYFNLSLNGQVYSFNVRSYLCGPETEVYKAAQALQVGQTIDVECYLYWYNGPQPRVINITVK